MTIIFIAIILLFCFTAQNVFVVVDAGNHNYDLKKNTAQEITHGDSTTTPTATATTTGLTPNNNDNNNNDIHEKKRSPVISSNNYYNHYENIIDNNNSVIQQNNHETDTDKSSSCICPLPIEQVRCQNGFTNICKSSVCYDSKELCNSLSLEERGFLNLCYIMEGIQQLESCTPPRKKHDDNDKNKQNKKQPMIEESTFCYYENQAIDITQPVRGNCEAGGCCQPDLPLCPLERYFYFMSLGYGITTKRSFKCPSGKSTDALGRRNNGCVVVTDGKSNDAVICTNAGITNNNDNENENKNNNNNDNNNIDYDYCDISFSGTNDVLDILKEAFHVVFPTKGETITFQSDNRRISFVTLQKIAELAFGKTNNDENDNNYQKDNDGIVDIVFQQAQSMDCFSRPNAGVHIMGHSLGGAMANFLAMKLAVAYPNLHVKITTMGEPALFLEPLQGDAATIQAWNNKERYINGRIMPRNPILDRFKFIDTTDEYGLHQDYCPISQVLPGGHHTPVANVIFLCEVVQPNTNTIEFFMTDDVVHGCATTKDSLSYLQNKNLPDFPHAGGLEFLSEQNETIQNTIDAIRHWIEVTGGLWGLGDSLLDTFNVLSTIADQNFQEAFFQLIDLHFIRRSIHVLNRIYDNGNASCSSTKSSTTTKSSQLPPTMCPIPKIIVDDNQVGDGVTNSKEGSLLRKRLYMPQP